MLASLPSVATYSTPARWWESDPSEIFWLEITDREDLGVDLNAPSERESGGSYWSYEFVREVREGDIVLHYRTRPINAITHWSRAVGNPYADQVYWGAHGQASGRGPVDPYWRDGWRHPLDGPYALPAPLTAVRLHEREHDVGAIRDALEAAHPRRPVYFPFQLSDTRELRAFQGYLTKFPRALVEAFPELAVVSEIASATAPTPANPAPAARDAGLGREYRRANPETRTARRDPFSVDPDLVDRALWSHAETQEALAEAVTAAGLVPRSPLPGEPVFDIAWEDNGTIVVAEVKSLTPRNEEKQLRLALGQVLRYAHLLGAKGQPVRRVIAAERKPTDGSWVDLAQCVGVLLVWPQTFATLFEPPAAMRSEPPRILDASGHS